jgi:hypothetical protein
MRLTLSILLLAASLHAQPWSDVTLSQPNGGAAASPGFSPTNNYPTETQVWWDTSLYYTNAGVVILPDRQTGAFHATNATASKFPLYGATWANGVAPAITFDGADDWLRTRTGVPYSYPYAIVFLLAYNYTVTNTPPEQRLVNTADSALIIRATGTSNARYFAQYGSASYWTNHGTIWMTHTYIVASASSVGCYTNFSREFNGSSGATPSGSAFGLGGRFSDGAIPWNGSVSQIVLVTNIAQSFLSKTLTNSVLSNIVAWMTNYAAITP